MADTQITIRKEALPVRCEICHQSDQFEPETGHCFRCEDVSEASFVQNPPVLSQKEREAYFRRLNAQLAQNRALARLPENDNFFELSSLMLLKLLLVGIGMVLILLGFLYLFSPFWPNVAKF